MSTLPWKIMRYTLGPPWFRPGCPEYPGFYVAEDVPWTGKTLNAAGKWVDGMVAEGCGGLYLMASEEEARAFAEKHAD